MYSIKPILLITAIVALLFIIAWKQQSPSANPVSQKLPGKWNWVQSKCGKGAEYSSPATAKQNKMIEFDKRGMYKQYTDGKKITEHGYTIVVDSISYPTKTYWISNAGYTRQSVMFKGDDTLTLVDECDNCCTSVYARQK